MNYGTFFQWLPILVGLLSVVCRTGAAQNTEISRQVAGTAGRGIAISSGDWANHTVEFTIGEAVVATVGDATHTLTQGFHQPEIFTVVSTRDISAAFDTGIVLFPNPADQRLHISFTSPRGYAYRVQVVNAQGQMLGPERLVADDDIAGIDLGSLPSGIYWLRLYLPALPKPVMYPFVKK